MKIKNAALNSLLYALYMIGSCFIVMLVEALLVFLINKFVAIPYPVLTILRAVVYTGGVLAILALLGYTEGYRESAPAVAETVISGIVAMVLQFLFALLFHFQAFVAGGVRFVAGLIAHGMSITGDALTKETSYGYFILMFAVYGLMYIAVLTVSRSLGAQRRIIDRAELRRGEKTE